jgi:X-X-X-Leu-X-X-Gly heptad repeat protein
VRVRFETVGVNIGTVEMRAVTSQADSGSAQVYSGTVQLYSGTVQPHQGDAHQDSRAVQPYSLAVRLYSLAVQPYRLDSRVHILGAQLYRSAVHPYIGAAAPRGGETNDSEPNESTIVEARKMYRASTPRSLARPLSRDHARVQHQRFATSIINPAQQDASSNRAHEDVGFEEVDTAGPHIE